MQLLRKLICLLLLSAYVQGFAFDFCDECCFDSYRLYGSWLYWKQDGDEYQYAVIKEGGTLTSLRHFDKETIHNIKFSWDQGFRLGVGKQECCLGFDLDLVWTHFRTGSTSSIRVIGQESNSGLVKGIALPSFALLSTIVLANEQAVITGRDRFQYDVIDLEASQWFNFNHELFIRPFLGIRIANLKESFRNELRMFTPLVLATADIFVHDQIKFKGAGILAGLDLDYYLCDGWSLMGGASGALLQGYNHLKNHSRYNTGILFDAFNETIKEHYRQLKPIVDLVLGIRYNGCLYGCYPFFLEFAWEEHLIFRQLRYRVNAHITDGIETAASTWTRTGTTTFQGITLSAGIQF